MKKITLFLSLLMVSSIAVAQKNKKPNILVLWGDDIGQSNISTFTKGMMGYQTPNIDRIANEGITFTDYYAEQSCTAGRSSFITGQSVYRTGLSKVGFPGDELGLQIEDPTIAGILKDQGYATGQFGKNHLGDRDEMLPTNHGFDEFMGNLYHLNAHEDPEEEEYPRDLVLPNGKTFLEQFGPRGIIHSYAGGEIKDLGPLTKKRMETLDDETSDRAIEFIKESVKAGKPFFVWWNGTRMHFRTHVKEENRGISGQNEYADGMVEHDLHIGKFLKLLDELGIADNTILLYSSDNGPHKNSWPDAGNSPFRGEKNTNWEGGWRAPAFVRWPGQIKSGSISNGIVHHMDWFPTFLSIAGNDKIKEQLLNGYNGKSLGRNYKVHLDGYDITEHIKDPQNVESPRKEIFYFNDEGHLMALRYNDWKLHFLVQKTQGTMAVWSDPFEELRFPLLFNLRRDPYEEATITSNTYWDWYFSKSYFGQGMSAYIGTFMATLKEYPPRQAGNPNLSLILDKIKYSTKSH